MSASRDYPARPFLAASVAVMCEDSVLLIRRARPPLAGLFSLPGGLVEPGETLAEAALRELREEVGIEAEIGAVLDLVEIIERDSDGRARRHFVVAAHMGRWLSGEPAAGDEALEPVWMRKREADRLPTTPGLLAILDLAFAASSRGPGTKPPDGLTEPHTDVNLVRTAR